MASDERRSTPITHGLNLLTALGFEGSTLLRQLGPLKTVNTFHTASTLVSCLPANLSNGALYKRWQAEAPSTFPFQKPTMLFSLHAVFD